jgi:ribosomal protein L16 Arg81 hydroxylase
MARSFDQVLADVTARSDPQRQTVLSQIADLPNQQAAQTSAIGAQKDQAYSDITDDARRRGLGFSGIPLGEQAKYAATTYAPALANLASSFNNQKGTLESALSQIGQNDYSTANDIFNQERNFEEQQRQFNENLAFQKQQAAQQAAAARASNAALSSLYGGGTQQQAPTDPYASVNKQNAANAIVGLLKTNNAATVAKTIAAIGSSARNGNLYDQYKLALLRQYQASSPYAKLINSATSGPSVAKGIL